jgi:ATP-binding cassette, subfamily C, bacteriocin exporter
MFARVLKVKQRDATDCAAACLHSIAAYHGRGVSVARLRQFAGTDATGTTVNGVITAARELGLTAKGVKGPVESLIKIPKPAIAHIIADRRRHFVVVEKATKRHIGIMDPASGRRHWLPLDDFAAQWTGVLVLFAPAMDPRRVARTPSALERFCTLVRPHRSVVIQALVGSLAFTILGLGMAVYVQKVVDNVIVDGNRNLLNLLSVAMLFVLAAQFGIGQLKSLLVLHTGQRIDAELILGYYEHLLRLPQAFFDTMRVGEIVSRVNDAVKIRAFINDVALDLAVNALVVFSALGLTFVYDWRLALLMALLMPAFAALYVVTNRINQRTQRDLMTRGADLEGHLVESIGAVRTLKRLGAELHAGGLAEARLVRLLRLIGRSARTSITANGTAQGLTRLFAVMLLWVGAGHVIDGSMTPGRLMSCYALLGYLTGPLAALISANRTLQDALIAGDRLFEILDLEREQRSDSTTFDLTRDALARNDIEMDSVRYRYGSRTTVFRELSLQIPPGQITAIVGESGSGKSTLAALLQKLYPVTEGHIRIGGTDLAHLSPSSLRRLIGVVPQQIELFSGTVIENIALGDPLPDVARVVRLCESLGLGRVLQQLPLGLDTDLGAGASALSGGERQRLAIARALYRDPEVLVLDEATSALDPQSEELVRRVLGELSAGGKTVIVITHRVRAAAAADSVALLGQGRVLAHGPHATLLRDNPAYAALWQQHALPNAIVAE